MRQVILAVRSFKLFSEPWLCAIPVGVGIATSGRHSMEIPEFERCINHWYKEHARYSVFTIFLTLFVVSYKIHHVRKSHHFFTGTGYPRRTLFPSTHLANTVDRTTRSYLYSPRRSMPIRRKAMERFTNGGT